MLIDTSCPAKSGRQAGNSERCESFCPGMRTSGSLDEGCRCRYDSFAGSPGRQIAKTFEPRGNMASENMSGDHSVTQWLVALKADQSHARQRLWERYVEKLALLDRA